ncbi:ATP-dependent Clp protease [Cutibacterium acnes JCM 18909]|nr:ATP-dependent Clp protease [Cutibacterium acnes JCM 18909]
MPAMAGPETGGAGMTDNVYQSLLRNRIVFLGSEVKDENANALCAQMLLLNAEDPEADIYLYINSPGGSVTGGMAIYDTMQWISNDVATVTMGMAASMGQFLLTAGTPGKRYALPHAKILMHQPLGGVGGTATEIAINAKMLKDTKRELSQLNAVHSGHTLEQILEDSDRDHWFTAQEALEYGSLTTSTAMRRSFAATPRISEVTMGFNAFDKNRLAALNAEQAEQAAPGGLAPAGPRNDYYIPQWEERTSYGVRRVDPYTKLFEDRIIFLGTPVTDDIANAVMAQLLCLQSMDADRQISMYINSPGGSFTAMTAIYDTMNYVRPDIQTICLGMAASAAAVLLAAGAKGQRLSLPNSTVLIHQPAMGQATYGQATDIEILDDEIQRIRKLMESMLATATGQSVEQISKDIDRDKYLTAQGAKEYGLIDDIFDLTVRFGAVVW